MLKERSIFRQYTVINDIKPILDFIKNLGCSDEASLEICTKALSTLMTLLSRQRSQTFLSLKKDSMYIDQKFSIFYISKSHWVVETLEKSGINTTTFVAHSTPSASTSSAHYRGYSLAKITNFSTFETFYDKPVN